MRILSVIFFCMLSFSLHANELETLALKQLPKIAALYADGYARLVKDSLQAKLLYKDKEGECTLISSFKMEGFSGAPNYTQFVGFFNCPTFHRLIKPNRKLFLSDMYRFFMGEPYLDISTAVISGDEIRVKGQSAGNKTSVITRFEPSPGPGWWQLKQQTQTQTQTEKKNEILPRVHGRF